jgi:excisionase family DNA binding protein
LDIQGSGCDSILGLYCYCLELLKDHQSGEEKLCNNGDSLSTKISPLLYSFSLTCFILRGIKADMKLLTTNEAAAILGVTKWRIFALIRDGRLPAERFGNAYMIKESDLKLVEDRKPGRPKKAGKKESSKSKSKS